jgi:hypothetical protein
MWRNDVAYRPRVRCGGQRRQPQAFVFAAAVVPRRPLLLEEAGAFDELEMAVALNRFEVIPVVSSNSTTDESCPGDQTTFLK